MLGVFVAYVKFGWIRPRLNWMLAVYRSSCTDHRNRLGQMGRWIWIPSGMHSTAVAPGRVSRVALAHTVGPALGDRMLNLHSGCRV